MLLYFVLGFIFFPLFRNFDEFLTSLTEMLISFINLIIAKNNIKIKSMVEENKEEEEPQETNKIGF